MPIVRINGMEIEMASIDEAAAFARAMNTAPVSVQTPPVGVASQQSKGRVTKTTRTVKHRFKNEPAEVQEAPPFTPFEAAIEDRPEWVPIIDARLKMGGWHELKVLIKAIGFDKDDTTMIHILRKMLSHMAVGNRVVIMRSRQKKGSPMLYASPEEEATKPRAGDRRVWSIT